MWTTTVRDLFLRFFTDPVVWPKENLEKLLIIIIRQVNEKAPSVNKVIYTACRLPCGYQYLDFFTRHSPDIVIQLFKRDVISSMAVLSERSSFISVDIFSQA